MMQFFPYAFELIDSSKETQNTLSVIWSVFEHNINDILHSFKAISRLLRLK